MRGLRVAAVCCLVLAAALPTLAQQSPRPRPIESMIDFFPPPAGQQFVASFTIPPVTGLSRIPDPQGDFEHSSGQEPGYTPDHIDILDSWALIFDPGPVAEDLLGPTAENAFWAPTGVLGVEPPSEEPFITITGTQPFDGRQHDDGTLMFGFDLAGTPELPVPGRCEYVIWVHDPSRGPTFVNLPSFPGDPAAGTNVAFGLRLEPEGQGFSSTFTLELEKGVGFVERPTVDVRSAVTPNFVTLLVPAGQVGELAGVNFYSFCMESGFTFEPELTGGDQTGLREVGFGDLGLLTIEQQPIPTTATTTIPEPTTQAVADTPSTTVAEVAPGEGSGLPWLILIGIGALLAGLAGWLLNRPRDPCAEHLKRWKAAQRDCDDARTRANEAMEDLENTDADLESLEQERKDLCRAWPPACWSSGEGSWVEDADGNRVTSMDVHLRKMALGDLWDDYRAGKLTASEVESQWQKMDTPEFREEMRASDQGFKELLAEIDADIADAKNDFDEAFERAQEEHRRADELCSEAAELRKKYEECVRERAVAEASAATAESETQKASAAVGAATTPTEPDLCDGIDPKRRVRITGQPESAFRVNVDFSVISEVFEGSGRNVATGKQMVIDLDEVAANLDFFGDMLSAQSAGLHIGKAAGGFRQGKYLATTGGVLKGGAEASMAVGVTPEVPTSPLAAGTELLEQTARLGSFVAGKVVEWMANYQIFEVRRTFFYQEIVATPAVIEECRDGVGWICVEKAWEISVSKLKRHRGRSRTWTVNSRQLRYRYEAEIRRLSESAANRIKNDADALVKWRAAHEPGPCD